MLICGVIDVGWSEKMILGVIWILDFGFQILDFGSASDQVLVVRRWTR